MSVRFTNDPASVVKGTACSVCWGPMPQGPEFQQTLDGVSRWLCTGCATRFKPVTLPGQTQPSRVVHIDVAAEMRRLAAEHPPLEVEHG